MKKLNKKAQMQTALYGLLTLGLFLVIIGFILSFGADFTNDQRTDIATEKLGVNCGQNSSGGTGTGLNYNGCGYAYNITTTNLEAMDDVSEAQGTVSTVGILVIIVGLLVGVVALLAVRGRKDSY